MGSEIVLCVAGNKVDLERKRVVSRQDAAAYADSVGAHYSETSAKTGRGIDDLFGSMGRRLLQSKKIIDASTPGGSSKPRVLIAEDDAESSRSGGCC